LSYLRASATLFAKRREFYYVIYETMASANRAHVRRINIANPPIQLSAYFLMHTKGE
jgi:hypothetical protein